MTDYTPVTDHAARLRHLAIDLEDLACLDVSEEASQLRTAADHIDGLEARYAVEVANHRNCLDSHEWAMQRIKALEAEIHRLRHFAWVIEEHGEALVTEAAIALHPQVKVDVVKDGSIAYPPGHGPNDPPRPVQRHD